MHTGLELTLKLKEMFYEDLYLDNYLLVGFCKHGNETFRLVRGRYLFSPFSCPKINPSPLIELGTL
jgi:hypothetical protein